MQRGAVSPELGRQQATGLKRRTDSEGRPPVCSSSVLGANLLAQDGPREGAVVLASLRESRAWDLSAGCRREAPNCSVEEPANQESPGAPTSPLLS